MNIIIYNPNSRGGNFNYALRLSEAYKSKKEVKQIILVLPCNAKIPSSSEARKILLSDQPLFSNFFFSKLYFLYRTFVNPLIFFLFLKKKQGYVIFNDFDQVSSYLWVPLYRRLKPKLVFSAVLHDPDRDQYFRNLRLSIATMRSVMSIMDIAFYHEILPVKPYYNSNLQTVFVPVPHGLYDLKVPEEKDRTLQKELETFKGKEFKLIGALGNIRHEKNYKLIIQVLKEVSGVKLFIGGLPANTSVNMMELEQLIENDSLTDRVLILPKYLDDAELRTIASVCDAFILYYSNTFKSQSGILNLLAAFKKTLLVSSNDSPLSKLVKRFNLGLMAKPDRKTELKDMLCKFAENEIPEADWQGYFAYASWANHVNMAIHAFKELRP